MSQNPLNLAVRFLLELGILAALAPWGWSVGQDAVRWLLAIGAPLVAALLWGVFRVPGDGGDPVMIVPGAVRLLLEVALFGLAVAALLAADRPRFALIFGGITSLHYTTQ
jgi:hypothetical protein